MALEGRYRLNSTINISERIFLSLLLPVLFSRISVGAIFLLLNQLVFIYMIYDIVYTPLVDRDDRYQIIDRNSNNSSGTNFDFKNWFLPIFFLLICLSCTNGKISCLSLKIEDMNLLYYQVSHFMK